MKKFFTTICTMAAAALLFICCSPRHEVKSYNLGINIIPTPQTLIEGEGYFKLNRNNHFEANSPEAGNIAAFFASKINTATGYHIKTAEKGDIRLTIDPEMMVENNEGYTLEVTKDRVDVCAKTARGLFYGMQSFMQLLPAEIESPSMVSGIAWQAPAVHIKDAPRFGYRGILLDACRHFIPVEVLKKQLDVLSLFKVNKMHLHLSDDQGWRIEIKKYPKLTEIGSIRIDGEGTEYKGFYTQAEIRDLVKYAQERFITIIPEIEIPGHELAAISAYPELSCRNTKVSPNCVWGIEDVVMCPGKEETFEFLENVINEVVELFPGEYFHIGGDECPKKSWKNCPLCQNRIKKENLQGDKRHSAEEKLQSYVIQRVEKILSGHGKKLIGWDEILEGGLAPTATVMSWRGVRGGIASARQNHDVIMSPFPKGLYLDHYQGDSKIEPIAIGGHSTLQTIYNYDPVPKDLVTMKKEKFVKGVQGNCWTEYIFSPQELEYAIYPRIITVSEIGWTNPERKDFKDFLRRIENACVRLDGHGINYHIPLPEQPGGSCNFVAFTDKVSMEFKTTRPIRMVYSTDGSDLTPNSRSYDTPIEFTRNTTVKIASVLPSGKMSAVRTIRVEKQSLSPAMNITEKTSGLEMKVTDGRFLNMKEFNAAPKNFRKSVIKELKEICTVVKPTGFIRDMKQYAAIAQGYVDIPEDGVYFISSDLEEVWLDNRLLVNNSGEVKRYSRHDNSIALAKGLHKIKIVFLGHIIGGWPSNLNDGSVKIRKSDMPKFTPITAGMLFH